MRSKKRYKKNAWSTEKKRVVWSEMSYVWHLDILLVERMVRNFSTNHGVKKGETHITFDLTVELLYSRYDVTLYTTYYLTAM